MISVPAGNAQCTYIQQHNQQLASGSGLPNVTGPGLSALKDLAPSIITVVGLGIWYIVKTSAEAYGVEPEPLSRPKTQAHICEPRSVE